MTTRIGASEKGEKNARLTASLAVSGGAGLLAFLWLHEALAATVFAVFLMAALYGGWVIFAFEATPEYRAAQNIAVDTLAGRAGVVVESCPPRGRVRVKGEVWHAESTDGTPLPAGQAVVIKGLATNLVLLVERD